MGSQERQKGIGQMDDLRGIRFCEAGTRAVAGFVPQRRKRIISPLRPKSHPPPPPGAWE